MASARLSQACFICSPCSVLMLVVAVLFWGVLLFMLNTVEFVHGFDRFYWTIWTLFPFGSLGCRGGDFCAVYAGE